MTVTRSFVAAAALLSLVACQKSAGRPSAQVPASVVANDSEGAGAEGDAATAEVDGTETAPTDASDPLLAPKNVAAPPADAAKTARGVFFKVLEPGDGRVHPSAADTVKVHYTGWTTDGEMFDSSVARGQPATFPLSKVIAGWRDGVQQMVVGDVTRFWIPEELAYQGKAGTPQGMLVFDVELLEIKKAPAPPANVARPPKNAKKTAKGVFYEILEQGDGAKKPRPFDTVKVHYTGWTTDGEMFDSSVTRGLPATFPLNALIPGWSEGVGQMVVGDRARLWIPEKLAYQGEAGRPQGMLVFDVELLEIIEKPEPPPVPKHVAKPPKNAKKTAKGVFYKVLERGDGKVKPTAADQVKVHYTGWTTDGKMFDSSVTRGRPATFPLGAVIAGWTDGVQQMVVGDKMRFWIPEELAYQGKPGRPEGMLVFDVELLEIVEAAH